MKRLTLLILSLFIYSTVFPVQTEHAPSLPNTAPSLPHTAPSIRLSDKYASFCLGSLYYPSNYAYQLNFETENLDLTAATGEGKLLTITIVVPQKGNKRTSLPVGDFTLGSCDSLTVGAIDYYATSAEYYAKINDRYDQPDERVSFLQCNLKIEKLKGKKYSIILNYELTNGERGTYEFLGEIALKSDTRRAKFNFLPDRPCIKNWQITDYCILITDTTAYHSRQATLKFKCEEDMVGFVVLYLSLDSINGRYEFRYGKEPGTCEPSRGGFYEGSYYTLTNGGIEDYWSGSTFYPLSGYLLLTDRKLYFEFLTTDGSTLRAYCYGTPRFTDFDDE